MDQENDKYITDPILSKVNILEDDLKRLDEMVVELRAEKAEILRKQLALLKSENGISADLVKIYNEINVVKNRIGSLMDEYNEKQ